MWKLIVYSDSDWAGDKDTRHSVGGYIMYLAGVPILWKSKIQRTVSLSSAEAEYYALAEANKGNKLFSNFLSRYMRIILEQYSWQRMPLQQHAHDILMLGIILFVSMSKTDIYVYNL